MSYQIFFTIFGILLGWLTSPATAGCAGTLCGSTSSEPLTPQIQALRDSTSCTLDNALVQAITPGAASNPQNVKNLEQIFPESKFNEFFPRRNGAYTYTNFIRAVGKYPAICANAANCPKILAGMFAHFQQETAGLFYIEEVNKPAYCANWSDWIKKSYPCVPGKSYFGRGAKQLSWNYNYGAFSKAMYGDAMVLLENPERVASTWLNFAATMWFFVTPQPPKPSMLQVVEGTWTPNSVDTGARLEAGFGATTMIINGALECGGNPSNANGARNRADYYKGFAGKLGVDITGEKLTCSDSHPFSAGGSAGALALYWGPNSGCNLVKWQTAYSSLVEGDYSACKGVQPTSCGTPVEPTPPVKPPTITTTTTTTTAAPNQGDTGSGTGSGSTSGSCDSLVVDPSGWSGSFGGKFKLPLTKDISSYTLEVETDRPLNSLVMWDGVLSPASGSQFTATNKPWFGGKRADEKLELAFQAGYSGTKPTFTSITLNGVKLC